MSQGNLKPLTGPGKESPPNSLNPADSQRLRVEGEVKEKVFSSIKSSQESQFGSKGLDFVDPILKNPSKMIKRMIRKLMSTNSLAVIFIIGSFHSV